MTFALGLALLAVGALAGLRPDLLEALISGPAVVRLTLAVAAGLIGIWYLLGAVGRLAGDPREGPDEAAPPAPGATPRPFAEMVRGVRYVFLAVAAFAVGAAFVVSHPLPLVIGTIIAGVDIMETSFLLLVGGRTGPDTEG